MGEEGRHLFYLPLSNSRSAVRFYSMRAIVMLISVASIAMSTRAQDLTAERAILVDLFHATGGSRWKTHKNWNTDVSICYWEGVLCDYIDGDERRPVVAGLSLDLNNLNGRLPATLSKLTHLHRLSVVGNDLEGEMPESLLAKWDRGELELSWERNRFNNLLSKVIITQVPTAIVCAGTSDVSFRFEVFGGESKIESVHCAPKDRTICSVRSGTVWGLDRLSRALASLIPKDSKPADYDFPFGFMTHGTYLTAAWVWGDGSTTSVKTYGRQGPLAAWTAQQLSLGLLSDTVWQKAATKPKCDFER
jgi:hypothetical protein